MELNLVTNSQRPLGALIEKLSEEADDVFMAAAYISAKAVDALVARLGKADSAPTVDLLFGIDLETDTNVLERLVRASSAHGGKLNARYTPHKSGRLFHPKLYFFGCGANCHVIISSANFTHRGQFVNEEAYCHIECASSHPVVHQLAHIRRSWLSDPFSTALDASVLQRKQIYEAAKRELEEAYGRGGSIPSSIKDVGRPAEADTKTRLLSELNRGYLVSTDFSVAPLSVPIPIREGDTGKSGNANAVIVRSSLTAWVQLLPPEICGEFAALNREAKRVVEQHSVLVPQSAYYIPASAHKSFTAATRSLISEHKRLINKYIRLKTLMNSYLAHELRTGCIEVWQRYKDEAGVLSENDIYRAANERIKERREEFSRDPYAAVRLIINSYPHPLISRAQNPEHPAWTLHTVNLDDDLLTTVIAVLVGQVEAVIEATRKRQQPAVQQDYKRAKLLVSIKGVKIDNLLITLGRLANKDWGKVNKHRKSKSSATTPGKLMTQELIQLSKQAKDHLEFLKSCKRKEQEEAFNLLLQEYPSMGLEKDRLDW